MGTFFAEGGFGMYPTLLFGFLLVASAVLTLLEPARRWPLTATLGVATLCSGALGATMGLINTMKYAAKAPVDDRLVSGAIGIAESLNNLVLAFVIVIPSVLITAVAAARAMRAAK